VEGLAGAIYDAASHQEIEKESDAYQGELEDVTEDPVLGQDLGEPAWRWE
jgi:hypothetical protein